VIQVAAGGGLSAAGGAAPGGPGGDQVPELAAGLIPGLGLPVVAAAAGDRGELDPQVAEVVLGPAAGRRPLGRDATGVACGAEVGGVW